MPIPTYIQPPTQKQRKDAVHRLYNDMTAAVKLALKDVSDEELEKLIADTMQFMAPPSDLEEITIPAAALKQTALFAVQSATSQLLQRHKKK